MCRVTSELIGIKFSPQQRMCNACCNSEFPRTVNTVTCSVAKLTNTSLTSLLICLHDTEFNRPGTCLKNIFTKLKVVSNSSCNCEEFEALMNFWGTYECEKRMPEILQHIKTKATLVSCIKVFLLGGYTSPKQLVAKAIQNSKVRRPMKKLIAIANDYGVTHAL